MNPRTARTKGAATETAFVEFAKTWGVLHAERRHLAGSDDRGDIAGWPYVVVEVKSGARIDLAGWIAELEAEITNAEASTGFVAIRPKGRPHPSKWFAALPLPVLMRLMLDAGWINPADVPDVPGEVAA